MLGTIGIGSGLSAGVASATNAAVGTTLLNGALATGIQSGLAKVGIGQAATGVGQSAIGTAQAAQSTVSGIAGAQSAIANGGVTGILSGSSVAGAGSSLVGSGFSSAAGTGFFSKVGSVLGSMAKTNAGQMMIFSGISQGVKSYTESKKEKKERDRQRKLNFFGGPMRGGSSQLPDNIRFPGFDPRQDGTQDPGTGFGGVPDQNAIEQPGFGFGSFEGGGSNGFDNLFGDDFALPFISQGQF